MIDEQSARSWVIRKTLYYILATFGPIATAFAHFTLSLIMLKVLSTESFGIFTFLFVVSQLSWGVWSALFCAPLPIMFSGQSALKHHDSLKTIFATNLAGSLISIFVFLSLALALGLSPSTALCFSAYGATALMRWFGRAYCYVQGQQFRTSFSDIIYSASLLFTLACGLEIFDLPAQVACYLSLFTGAMMGLLPFGFPYFAQYFKSFGKDLGRNLRSYSIVWRAHARWALLGVITSEATANAHVYLITLIKGPSAIAPIAAAGLLIRPIQVAQNALSEFERPQMANLIKDRLAVQVSHSLRVFRLVLAAIWFIDVTVSIAVLITFPRLLFSKTYELEDIEIAGALWAILAVLRLLQTPESTVLQAGGEFKSLAFASVCSSFGTIILVVILIPWLGALWSMVGLIAGAIIYLCLTHHFARKFMQMLKRTESY